MTPCSHLELKLEHPTLEPSGYGDRFFPDAVAYDLDGASRVFYLSVELSRRAYPERALWQAFAYTAFDPHADITPELTQLETGHLVVRTGNFRAE